jgi:DNA-binding NarL/FixJ family response regulator
MTRTAGPEPIRIVLVGEHRMYAESLERFLGANPDFSVVGVGGTCERGVALAVALRPDVAVIDNRLPDGDATSLASAVVTVSPSTQVLALLSECDAGAARAANSAGCAGFLSKDHAINDLIDAVRRVHADGAIRATEFGVDARLGARSQARRGDLSGREFQILALLAEGLSIDAIADRLIVSVHTIRNQVHQVIAKLGAHSKFEAVAIAQQCGLVAGAPSASLVSPNARGRT